LYAGIGVAAKVLIRRRIFKTWVIVPANLHVLTHKSLKCLAKYLGELEKGFGFALARGNCLA
jgi:hypothetical protein